MDIIIPTFNPAAVSGRYLNRRQQQELREQAVVQIRAMLAERPLTAADIADKLGLHRSTAFAHLHHMARELREVRRSGKFDQGRELWELGADHTLRSVEDRLDGFKQRAASVPARQVGMWRDGLVAALFGPALPSQI